MYQDFASRLAQMRQARRGGGSGAAKLESTPVAKEKSVSPTPQGRPSVATTLLPSGQTMWGRGGGFYLPLTFSPQAPIFGCMYKYMKKYIKIIILGQLKI